MTQFLTAGLTLRDEQGTQQGETAHVSVIHEGDLKASLKLLAHALEVYHPRIDHTFEVAPPPPAD